MDDNISMMWLLLLFMLASNNTANQFKVPTNEEICEIFTKNLEHYLDKNEEALKKASADSPLGLIHRLTKTSKKIEDPDVRVEVLSAAMSIMSKLDEMNGFCCCNGKE